MDIDPEQHIRSLGHQLLPLIRRDPRNLLATSSQMQAVANAFVMLGLLTEEKAEAALADHRRTIEALGIELNGVMTGELTLVPGSAHGFTEASQRGEEDLDELPLAFATPRARLSLAIGDLVLDCLVLTRSGLRGRMWIESSDEGTPLWSDLAQDLSLMGDTGTSYRAHLTTSGIHKSRSTAQEQPVTQLIGVTLQTEPALPNDIRWLEFSSQNAAAVRVILILPPQHR